MTVAERTMTAAEFDAWAALPENRDHSYEFIGGRIVEVVSNQESSFYGSYLVGLLAVYVRAHKLGFTTGADGGYMVSGERYIPDGAFVSRARQSKPSRQAYSSIAPDLAVEVLSPSNTPDEIRIKIANYLLAGTTVWLVDADRERIEVYAPGAPVRVLRSGDSLDGGSLLPGFAVAVADILTTQE